MGHDVDMRVVAAPDKLRGTASAAEVAAADRPRRRAPPAGRCDEVPMADGGEGTLDALGGPEPHHHGHRPARRPGGGRPGGWTGAPR